MWEWLAPFSCAAMTVRLAVVQGPGLALFLKGALYGDGPRCAPCPPPAGVGLPEFPERAHADGDAFALANPGQTERAATAKSGPQHRGGSVVVGPGGEGAEESPPTASSSKYQATPTSVPVNHADNWLHVAVAAAVVLAGLVGTAVDRRMGATT